MSEERNKRIIDLYKHGFTIVEVARLVGCRHTTVSQIVRTAGIARSSHVMNLGRVKEEELRDMYLSGIKVPTIVERTGISEWVVREALHNQGVDTSQERTVKLKSDQDRIVQMYQSKHTGGEIARELDIPLATVYRELRRAGIRARKWAGPKTLFKKYVAADGSLTRFKSTWEIAFAKYLDSQQIQWAYEARTWLLADGSSYTPDFWIPTWDLHVEIKGYMTDEAAKKISMFRAEYPHIALCVVDRNVFNLYGIQLPKYNDLVDEFYHQEMVQK